MKGYYLLLIFLLIPLAYAQEYSDCSVYGNCKSTTVTPTVYINETLFNVNNSQYLESHPASYFYQASNPSGYISSYSESDPICMPYINNGTFYLNSNPLNFINSTYNSTYAQWAYNQTIATYNLYNGIWSSTYNITYHDKADYQFLNNNFNGSGNVTASYFIGDGSLLTGISGMNYTNLAMLNQSNDFGNNNITTTGTLGAGAITGTSLEVSGAITTTGDYVNAGSTHFGWGEMWDDYEIIYFYGTELNGATNTNWDASYTHSINNTQAHSDYLLNTGGDTGTGNYNFTNGNNPTVFTFGRSATGIYEGRLKVIADGSGAIPPKTGGVQAVDPINFYASVQSPSSIDGFTCDSSGEWTAWGDFWLGYYSTGNTYWGTGGLGYLYANGKIKPVGYESADGSAGITASPYGMTFKDGLLTASTPVSYYKSADNVTFNKINFTGNLSAVDNAFIFDGTTHNLNISGNVTAQVYHGTVDWVQSPISATLNGNNYCDQLDNKISGYSYTCKTCINVISGATVTCSTTASVLSSCGCQVD